MQCSSRLTENTIPGSTFRPTDVVNLQQYTIEYSTLGVVIDRRLGLMPNTHPRRRRDLSVELSRIGAGGVYWT